MTLDEFNKAERAAAVAAIRPCLDIDRWVNEIVDARPFSDKKALIDTAQRAAVPLNKNEIDGALAHHPRIGERASGNSPEARISAAEQAALGSSSAELEAALSAGNAEYERRFERVFLIRAAGRSRQEVLAELERRMQNTPDQEIVEVANQLREIAVLRLQGVITL